MDWRTTGNIENQLSSVPSAKSQDLEEKSAVSNCQDGSAKVEDLTGSGKDLNITLRLAIYDFAFNAWLVRPFLGYGAYDKRRLVRELPAEDKCAVLYMDHPHNLYLYLGISGGLILLLPVFLLVCAPLLQLMMAFSYARIHAIATHNQPTNA
ncbi:O-antigen ligase family protein [Salaquimonas pukyongi]|uniref:O-antigen ligase family protein n=1 Tax=Salaquimonas pukyongi TaxID=2712698 RepID=UPI00096B9593|nr:O-antigen ligase family protein [Salaquimonas pukyongi]